MFNAFDGMDSLRAFIMQGIFRDIKRANVLQRMKAPHAYPASVSKPRFERDGIESLRRAKLIVGGKKPLLEAPSLIGSAPHGRLFKGHRP